MRSTSILRRRAVRGLAPALIGAATLAALPAAAQADYQRPFFGVTNRGCYDATTRPENRFRVPAGVTSVNVEAMGGNGSGDWNAVPPTPGRGVTINATVAVAAGDDLYVCVNANGQGGSGGFTSLGTAAVPDEPNLLVLAGGGGAAGTGPGTKGGNAGGISGGVALDAEDGAAHVDPLASAQPGGGARGGAAPANGRGGENLVDGAMNGYDGSFLGGGLGGPGATPGGSGGSGYRSGGGGAGSDDAIPIGAGGGGGTSYCAPAPAVTACGGTALAPNPNLWLRIAEVTTTTDLTTVETDPEPGSDVTYRATVAPAPSWGTVTFEAGSTPISGCEAVAVVAGVATCEATAPTTTSTIAATYRDGGSTGDDTLLYRQSFDLLAMQGDPTTTTTAPWAPAQVSFRQTSQDYEVEVSPAPSGGTVAFRLDGVLIPGCEALTLGIGGFRWCEGPVPAPGPHTLTVEYSGSSTHEASSDSVDFTVTEPVVSLSAAELAFGDVRVGTTAATQSVTLTNTGEDELWVGEDTRVPSFGPRASGPELEGGVTLDGAGRADYALVADDCTATVVGPGGSCTVTVSFTPSQAGARAASVTFATDALGGPQSVALSGTGTVDQQPQPREEPRQNPQPQPDQPGQPGQPGQQPQPRADPQPRAQPGRGATLAPAGGGVAPVSGGGRGGFAVRLPLICPAGTACTTSGTLVAQAGAPKGRASAAQQRVLARFRNVRVGSGQVRQLRLRLPSAFVRAAQRAGLRTVSATLTITTRFGGGAARAVTVRERVTLSIPRARRAQEPAPRQGRRPSFTG